MATRQTDTRPPAVCVWEFMYTYLSPCAIVIGNCVHRFVHLCDWAFLVYYKKVAGSTLPEAFFPLINVKSDFFCLYN